MTILEKRGGHREPLRCFLVVTSASLSRRSAEGFPELEEHLNVRLLHRGNRKLVLTDIRAQLCRLMRRRIMEEIAEVERAASGRYRAPQGRP